MGVVSVGWVIRFGGSSPSGVGWLVCSWALGVGWSWWDAGSVCGTRLVSSGVFVCALIRSLGCPSGGVVARSGNSAFGAISPSRQPAHHPGHRPTLESSRGRLADVPCRRVLRERACRQPSLFIVERLQLKGESERSSETLKADLTFSTFVKRASFVGFSEKSDSLTQTQADER